jgi:hypothetical protein
VVSKALYDNFEDLRKLHLPLTYINKGLMLEGNTASIASGRAQAFPRKAFGKPRMEPAAVRAGLPEYYLYGMYHGCLPFVGSAIQN